MLLRDLDKFLLFITDGLIGEFYAAVIIAAHNIQAIWLIQEHRCIQECILDDTMPSTTECRSVIDDQDILYIIEHIMISSTKFLIGFDSYWDFFILTQIVRDIRFAYGYKCIHQEICHECW